MQRHILSILLLVLSACASDPQDTAFDTQEPLAEGEEAQDRDAVDPDRLIAVNAKESPCPAGTSASGGDATGWNSKAVTEGSTYNILSDWKPTKGDNYVQYINNSAQPSIGTIDFLVGVCSSDVVSYYDTQTVTYNYKQKKLTTTSTYRCIAAGLTATKTGTFYWRKCAKT